MKPGRAVAVAAGGIGLGAVAVAAGRKASRLMSWRSRRMWRLTARNATRFAGTKARQLVTPAERRAELDQQFAIRTAEDVAKELGEMKGVLMKVGQLVSFIAEGLPDEAQAALAALQANAAPMAPSLAAEVVRTELGDEPERVFLRWDDLPVAAASIGQVHRAETKDHREVAVKVQFPGVREAIEEDLDGAEVMYSVFSAMALNGLDARGLVDELRLRMREELDYRLEARNIVEFAAHFAGHPWVRIPQLVPELSQERVLTTEWIDGMSWDQFMASASHETKQRVGEVIWRFGQHSIQRLGAFNGDPHPGNYRFHHDGSVSFLDFGLVKRWDPGEWELLEPSLDAIVVHRDPERLVAAMEHSGFLAAGHGLDPGPRLRVRLEPVPAVPRRRVHVHPGLDARHARADLRPRRPVRRGDLQAEHAAQLRHPRPRGLGRQRHPRQAQRVGAVAGDAAGVPQRRPAGHRARRRRSGLARQRPLARRPDARVSGRGARPRRRGSSSCRRGRGPAPAGSRCGGGAR